jgi:pimeloyl-ACP methyl ester carboxylesterase
MRDVVLVPGLLCDANVWRPQMQALADIARFQVSEHGTQDSLPGMARTILESAPARFALAGHSMGGRIAIEVVRIAPDRVTALGLFDTGYVPLAPGAEGEKEAAGRHELLSIARRDGMRAMGRKWIQGMVHPSRLEDTALIDAVLDMFEAKSPDIFAAQIRALLNRPDGANVLPTIKCPTLVLCGHEDAWSPPQRHLDIASRIARSTFVDIPECGHMSTMERPEAVNQAMRAWLQA